MIACEAECIFKGDRTM